MVIHLKEQRFIPAAMCSLAVIQSSVSFNVFPFLRPLSFIVLGLCILSFLIMFAIYLRRPTISMFGLTTSIHLFMLIAFSLISATDIKNAIYTSVVIWLLLLLFHYYSHNIRLLLQTVAFTFSVCIYINLLVMVMFPDWMFAAEDAFDSFLLGGNYNSLGCRFMTGFVCNLLCIKYGKKWLFNSILIFIISVVTLVLVGSMTSLSVILLFAVLSLIPSVKLQKAILIGWFFFYLLFHFFVVFNGESLHNNELAVYFIEDVLGKDITFTNRTGMWDAALRVIADSPIIGYGLVDSDWYLTNMFTFAIGPHNMILALLIYGGLALLLTFFVQVVFAVHNIIDCFDRMGGILMLGTMSLLFMMTFEVYPTFFITLLLLLICYYPEIQKSQQDITLSYNSNKYNKDAEY